MTIEQSLNERSGSKCELCSSTDKLIVYTVSGATDNEKTADNSILICHTCQQQIDDQETMDINHWRCLNDSMWSPVPAVQVMAWRLLSRISAEGWPQDLLDMLYLDDELLAWAKAGIENNKTDNAVKHLDSNGVLLDAGDTVVIIKDLNVKGTSFVAKRGTAVRGISLVADNAEHIEGRVNGQRIVILTKFVKKSN